MTSSIKLAACAAAVFAVAACKRDMTRSRYFTNPGKEDVTGTYFAADSGHNLGKDWCYSAALVLDSTNHFGSVVRMCSDDGSEPVTENIKGTYTWRTYTVREDHGALRRKVSVILSQEGGRAKKHTLVYDNGTLRFDEPWWMGAGLRALEISDPVLKRITSIASTDSASVGAVSSTPIAPKAPAKKVAATK